MASPLFETVEGWTQELGPFTLRFGASATASDLTGKTITAVIRTLEHVYVTEGFTARVDDDPETGQVYLSIADYANLPTGTYHIRFKGVDGAGKAVFWPETGDYQFVIYRP